MPSMMFIVEAVEKFYLDQVNLTLLTFANTLGRLPCLPQTGDFLCANTGRVMQNNRLTSRFKNLQSIATPCRLDTYSATNPTLDAYSATNLIWPFNHDL